MKRCIDLAKNGLGQTYPNPMVGCVIVHDGKIIAEGWHRKAGEPHAEVNAINSLKDKSLINSSTIYVSLEPCSHYGKTPPCADLILEKGFKKVVIGMTDPFAKVKGRGIKKLLDHGCQVIVGICEDDCYTLNRRFITFHEKQKPYIILKWAESQDGFLSPYQFGKSMEKEPVWLTNAYSKQLVHQWRAEEQAILVGTNTALMDNPALTARLFKGKNPLRVLIDKDLKVSRKAKIFSDDAKTLVFTQNPIHSSAKNTEHISIDFREKIIPQVLKVLRQKDVQSLIVEGGRATLQGFIDSGLWDEARVFKTKINFNEGTKAPNFEGQLILKQSILEDELSYYKNKS
jgi:diaminohydroxyphosphoribosylaminopyrimidine deaminase/5-amino-6-(5-phosphoribosylamino)uracil reductase